MTHLFSIFLLTNCVDWGIIKIPAAACVSGRPIIAFSFGNVKKNFFVKLHKKIRPNCGGGKVVLFGCPFRRYGLNDRKPFPFVRPSTAGGGQYHLELAFVVSEAKLSFRICDLIGVTHRQDCGKECVQQGCLVGVLFLAPLACGVV